MIAKPQFRLDVDRLGVEDVKMLAVDTYRSTLYFGRTSSRDHQRRNLLIWNPSEGVRAYPDSPTRSGRGGDGTLTSSVESLCLNANRDRLYLTANTRGEPADPQSVAPILTVYRLDNRGLPVGDPHGFFEGQTGSRVIYSIATAYSRLYAVDNFGELHVIDLDFAAMPAASAPRTFVLPGGSRHFVSLSPSRRTLYVGGYPERFTAIELDAAGDPVLDATGTPLDHTQFAGAVRQEVSLKFVATTHALLLSRRVADRTILHHWPLDPVTERPVGFAQPMMPDLDLAESDGRPYDLAVDAPALWCATKRRSLDAFSGLPIEDGSTVRRVELDPATSIPMAVEPETHSPFDTNVEVVSLCCAEPHHVVWLTRARSPRALVNATHGWFLEIKRTAPAATPGTPEPRMTVWIDSGFVARDVQIRVDLDPFLRDKRGQGLLRIELGMEETAPWSVRLDLYQGDPAGGGALLKSLNEDVPGVGVVFLIPGYACDPLNSFFLPLLNSPLHEALVSVRDHAANYTLVADFIGIPEAERPQQFPIGGGSVIGPGSPVILERYSQALGKLGFNMIEARGWDGVSPADADQILLANGFKWRAGKSYRLLDRAPVPEERRNPDFDFQVADADLVPWFEQVLQDMERVDAGARARLKAFALADEPGWNFPDTATTHEDDPACLASFHALLAAQGLTPADFGKADWPDVRLAWLPSAHLPSAPDGRKIHYWTARFFTLEAGKAHRRARLAIEAACGRPIHTYVNVSRVNPDRWYIPETPDRAAGFFDSWELGRSKSLTLWGEDWADERGEPERGRYLQDFSFLGSLMRAATRSSNLGFGAYVIGRMLASTPALGGRYKILSLIGQGAKTLEMWTFGPEFLFPTNCWSEQVGAHFHIADTLRLLGRCEAELYPAQPIPSRVAIYADGASALWATPGGPTFTRMELRYLHCCLAHEGIQVDFVDDADLAGDALAARGYEVLYVTLPALSTVARAEIEAWVAAGGILCLTPGAAITDEYDEPNGGPLYALAGVALSPRVNGTIPTNREAEPFVARVEPAPGAPVEFAGLSIEVKGPIRPLVLSTAGSVARFEDGEPAIATKAHGAGQIFTYAFFPGYQYWISPQCIGWDRLPRGWGENQRRIAAAPARTAGVAGPVVVDHGGVEVCVLESTAPIVRVVVLLNWNHVPIPALRVTSIGPHPFVAARSVDRAEAWALVPGAPLDIQLVLKDVEVLVFT